MSTKKTNKHDESDLQQVCVKWFRLQYQNIMIISSLNGAMLSGTPIQRAIKWKRLEREGAVSGVADLQVICRNLTKNGLFIEMKTEKGKQSDNQKAFQKYCEKYSYQYSICRSLDEFVKVVTDYLNS